MLRFIQEIILFKVKTALLSSEFCVSKQSKSIAYIKNIDFQQHRYVLNATIYTGNYFVQSENRTLIHQNFVSVSKLSKSIAYYKNIDFQQHRGLVWNLLGEFEKPH